MGINEREITLGQLTQPHSAEASEKRDTRSKLGQGSPEIRAAREALHQLEGSSAYFESSSSEFDNMASGQKDFKLDSHRFRKGVGVGGLVGAVFGAAGFLVSLPFGLCTLTVCGIAGVALGGGAAKATE